MLDMRLVLNSRSYRAVYYFFSDGPTGKPNADPLSLSKHADEKALLTCLKPTDDGNPDCHIYIWSKLEENEATLQNSKTLEFIMEESWAGKYSCTCANIYGISAASNVAEEIFLAGPAPSAT